MQEDNGWKDLLHNLNFFAVMFATGLIDSAFLTLWVIAQWLVGTYVISLFPLSDTIDNALLLAFRVIFAISTLAPIVLHTYADIRIMGIEIVDKVQQAKEAHKKRRSNNRAQRKNQQDRERRDRDEPPDIEQSQETPS
ncbi:MAG: hypothetical protein HYR94_22935 [Chloroflexi bacterium]|nr:hypothetical protein [Chloroflexota bacterium]